MQWRQILQHPCTQNATQLQASTSTFNHVPSHRSTHGRPPRSGTASRGAQTCKRIKWMVLCVLPRNLGCRATQKKVTRCENRVAACNKTSFRSKYGFVGCNGWSYRPPPPRLSLSLSRRQTGSPAARQPRTSFTLPLHTLYTRSSSTPPGRKPAAP